MRPYYHIFYVLAFLGVVCLVRNLTAAEPAPSTAPESAPVQITEASTEPSSVSAVPFYGLTEEERDLVERVVMAEAGAEPYEGQKAVAQCILNACLLENLRPAQVVKKYKYTDARPEPTEAVTSAVSAVFDKGEQVIDSEALFFYAPAMTSSAWHESQDCVATIGGHKFFKEADQIGEN